MDIYKLLFDREEEDVLLKVLSLTKHNFSRYRSCTLEQDGMHKDIFVIDVCTRDGGNNREYAEDTYEDLITHPNYLYDHDDEFDNTYMYFVFSIPDQYLELLKTFYNMDKLLNRKNDSFNKLKEDLNS